MRCRTVCFVDWLLYLFRIMQKADLCLIVLTFFMHIIFSYVLTIQTLKVVSDYESDQLILNRHKHVHVDLVFIYHLVGDKIET